MSKFHTKEEQKKLLLSTLQENSGKLLPIVKDSITKILRYKSKRWVDMVDPKVKQKTLDIFELVKKLKPENKNFIDNLIKGLDREHFVYDKNGHWDFINKLNTNRSDFCIFIADLLEHSRRFDMSKVEMGIKKSDFTLLKEFLLEIEKHPKFIWDKFLSNTNQYTSNIRKNSEDGEIVENHISDYYIKNGWEIVHIGGNGDLIDMLLGVDLIVKKDDEYLFIQIKKIPSIDKIDIDDESYIEIKGDFIVSNRSTIDVVAYSTLDGENIFTFKKQDYYYYKGKVLKKEFGLPIPSTTYNNRVLVKF